MIISSELVGRHCNLLFTSKADRETCPHKKWNDVFNGQRERIARAEEINHHAVVVNTWTISSGAGAAAGLMTTVAKQPLG